MEQIEEIKIYRTKKNNIIKKEEKERKENIIKKEENEGKENIIKKEGKKNIIKKERKGRKENQEKEFNLPLYNFEDTNRYSSVLLNQDATFFDADGMPTGGHPVARFENGAWKILA